MKGLTTLDERLEEVYDSLKLKKIPAMWLKKSYPSDKSLGGYITDLVERLAFLQKWIDDGIPKLFWISGFFFTQSFLTGVLQNYARKERIAIDKLEFGYDFYDQPHNLKALNNELERPLDGCFIYGLYLEGCGWDPIERKIVESKNKVLFELAPTIHIEPRMKSTKPIDFKKYYNCPVYRTGARFGVLSTTGHSTNYIMNILLHAEQDASHWIKRGVALLSSLAE